MSPNLSVTTALSVIRGLCVDMGNIFMILVLISLACLEIISMQGKLISRDFPVVDGTVGSPQGLQDLR